MKYDRSEEKEKLEQVNEELVRFMSDYTKDMSISPDTVHPFQMFLRQLIRLDAINM